VRLVRQVRSARKNILSWSPRARVDPPYRVHDRFAHRLNGASNPNVGRSYNSTESGARGDYRVVLKDALGALWVGIVCCAFVIAGANTKLNQNWSAEQQSSGKYEQVGAQTRTDTTARVERISKQGEPSTEESRKSDSPAEEAIAYRAGER
jgi:hypothetical protein